MPSLLYRLFLVLLIVLPGTLPVNASDWRVEDATRVVALSDVHGAYEAMVETLGTVGLVDESLSWVGGSAHLVIVGDILDRGPRSRDAMDLLMRLEDEAQASGGKVHVLIGNHESMNMIGDLRYVSKAEYAAFADDETVEQRDRWFAAYARRAPGSIDLEALRQRFDVTFPAGFFALRAAFGTQGEYGRWLLGKPVIAVINGTAFVHGGLSPLVGRIGLDGVNEGLRKELAAYIAAVDTLMAAEILLPTDNYYDHEKIVNNHVVAFDATPQVMAALETVRRLSGSSLFTHEGPLWYRGNVACSPIIEEYRLDATLAAIGAERVVIGHTPTPGRQVLQRFGGRVVEVDTGMLSTYYKGSGHALVMQDGELTVFNQAAGAVGAPAEHPRKVGSRPGNLSAEDLQALLQNGEIVGQPAEDDQGRELVRVSNGEYAVSAIFHERSGRDFYPDVAAYRLDRLLGLDMVPVTVRRTVGRSDGSLQFLPDKVTDESQRSAEGRGNGASCPLPEQWAAMYVFDVLIYNEGRNLRRMLYESGAWSLMLTEHVRAFGTRTGRPPHLASAPLMVDEGWRRKLQSLTDEVLAEQFAGILDKRRLRALATRRDELLQP